MSQLLDQKALEEAARKIADYDCGGAKAWEQQGDDRDWYREAAQLSVSAYLRSCPPHVLLRLALSEEQREALLMADEIGVPDELTCDRLVVASWDSARQALSRSLEQEG